MTIQNWEHLANKKVAERDSKIPPEWRLPTHILDKINPKSPLNVLDVPEKCGLLSHRELEITGKYDAVALLEKMSRKELTSFEVTLAFCKRAAIAQQVVRRDGV